MSETARRWLVWGTVGLVLGLGLGFAVGWWLWPVEYVNTTPSALHARYADDYVLMVAAAYDVEGDLARAQARLAPLDADPTAAVVGLAERLIVVDGNAQDIARLARLAEALGSTPPSLRPYLDGAP